jgi:hypothetical protein
LLFESNALVVELRMLVLFDQLIGRETGLVQMIPVGFTTLLIVGNVTNVKPESQLETIQVLKQVTGYAQNHLV